MKHRPDIDGLRAVAVIPVVLYHLGWGFPGGFVGVDIFFVISGFLICGILLRDLERDRFSILDFYNRRIRRIFPALSAMLVAILLAAWWLYLPYELEQLGKHLTHVSLFLSNYWLVQKAGGYWSPDAESYPMLHTWSLAVEEQFYIFMPLLLWVLFKYFRRYLSQSLWTLLILSLVYGVYESQTSPATAFYLLPSRAWELLLGAVTFLLIQKPSSNANKYLRFTGEACGLTLLICSFFVIRGEYAFPGLWALMPTVGCALIIYSNSDHVSYSGRFLSWKPLQWIGLISYSLYLWHWPLIVFAKAYRYPNHLSLSDQSLILLSSLILAAISWRFIEQPFRSKRFNKLAYRVIFAGSATLCCFLGSSLAIRKWDGYPQRFEGRYSPEIANVIQSDVLDKKGSILYQTKDRFDQGGKIELNNDHTKPELIHIGDSHGAMLAPVVSEAAESLNRNVAFFTQDGDTPYFGADKEANRTIRHYIEKWKPDSIIVTIRWDSVWHESKPDSHTSEQNDALSQAFEWLSSQCQHLYVTLQPPRISGENARAAKILMGLIRQNSDQLPIIQELPEDRIVRKQTAAYLSGLNLPNLRIVDISSPFLSNSTVQYHENGKLYYRDDDHLNLRGARLSYHLIEQVLQGGFLDTAEIRSQKTHLDLELSYAKDRTL